MKKLQVALMGTTLAVALAVSGGSAYAAKGMVTAPAPAAMSGVYISVFGGIALPSEANGDYYSSESLSIPLNTGFLFGAAVGTQLMPNVRGEVELSYSSHGTVGNDIVWGSNYTGSSAAAGSLGTLYVLGNLWYDMNLNSAITPYIGAGAGFAVVMPNVNTYYGDYVWNKGSVAPAAQFGAGVKIPVADNMTVDIGYRAKAVFNAAWLADPTSSADDTAHASWLDQTVQVGLTVALP